MTLTSVCDALLWLGCIFGTTILVGARGCLCWDMVPCIYNVDLCIFSFCESTVQCYWSVFLLNLKATHDSLHYTLYIHKSLCYYQYNGFLAFLFAWCCECSIHFTFAVPIWAFLSHSWFPKKVQRRVITSRFVNCYVSLTKCWESPKIVYMEIWLFWIKIMKHILLSFSFSSLCILTCKPHSFSTARSSGRRWGNSWWNCCLKFSVCHNSTLSLSVFSENDDG